MTRLFLHAGYGSLDTRRISLAVLSLMMFTTVSLGQARSGDSGTIPTRATVGRDPRFEALRQEIISRVADDIPSFAIAVAQEGRILWEEAFGWADKEARVEATPHTAYPLASVTKSLIATGVMVFLEQTDVRLDDPIDAYVEDGVLTPLAGSLSEISIRDLLAMTGGFPQGWKGVYAPHPPQSTRELLRHHGGLVVFPPGERFHYSNFSPTVAELVVESVMGQTFDEFMQHMVFEPLGMTNTAHGRFGQDRIGARVVRYRADGGRIPETVEVEAVSSVSDLIRYALFHLDQPLADQRSILRAATLDTMHYSVSSLSENQFALGWWVNDLGDDMKLLISDGHGLGAVALVFLLPAADAAVVALMNTRKYEADWYNGPLTNKVAVAALDVLMPGFEARRAAYLEARAQQRPPAYVPSADYLGVWEGTLRDYEGERIPVEMRFQEDGDIHITLGDQFTALVHSAQLQDGLLTGQFPSQVRTDVDYPWDHVVRLLLHVEQDEAQGYLLSNFQSDEGVFGLPSYIHLERKP